MSECIAWYFWLFNPEHWPFLTRRERQRIWDEDSLRIWEQMSPEEQRWILDPSMH